MWVIMGRLMSSPLAMWQAGTVPERRSYDTIGISRRTLLDARQTSWSRLTCRYSFVERQGPEIQVSIQDV